MNTNVRNKKLEEGEIVPLTFDYVFTNIFNNPDNIIILENFLACYLEVAVNKLRGNIEILSRNLIIKHKKEANKQIDLLVDIEGEKINIELQNQMSEGIINRNVVFACKVHAGQLKLREKDEEKGSKYNYHRIKKTLQINLMRGKEKQQIKERYYLTNEEGEVLTKKLEIDVINMEKAEEICYTKEETKLARWCRVILATTKDEFVRALGEDLMEKEAKELLEEKVEQYSRDEEVIEMYTEYSRAELERQSVLEEATLKAEALGLEKGREEGIQRGIKQGIEQGMKQGEEKSRIEVARNLFKLGLSIEQISEATSLSIEELEKLK